MIDLDDVALIPRTHDPVSTAVLTVDPRHVKCVLVNGEVRKRDGNLVGVDVNRMAELAYASRSHLANAAGLRI
jgi:5-methylthioadenosine/S-adenosylhomocysteine deaminase